MLVSALPNKAKLNALTIVVLPVPLRDPLSSPPWSKFSPSTSVRFSCAKFTACVWLPTLIKFLTVSSFIFIGYYKLQEVCSYQTGQSQYL